MKREVVEYVAALVSKLYVLQDLASKSDDGECFDEYVGFVRGESMCDDGQCNREQRDYPEDDKVSRAEMLERVHVFQSVRLCLLLSFLNRQANPNAMRVMLMNMMMPTVQPQLKNA